MMQTNPEIVLVGGGSGASNLAEGIATALPEATVSVVVSVGDNGGSTGRLRELYPDVPAMGDVRKVLSSLALNREAAELFESRFEEGHTLETVHRIGQLFVDAVLEESPDVGAEWVQAISDSTKDLAADIAGRESLEGHSYGNIWLLNMAQVHGNDITKAVRDASKVLNLGPNRNVFPVTNQPHDLLLYEGDMVVRGQVAINRHKIIDHKNARVAVEPEVTITPEAQAALERADVRLYGPGSRNTSINAPLAVRGTEEAIVNGKANCIDGLVVNLVTDNESEGLSIADLVDNVEGYTGKNIDCVIYNDAPEKLPEGTMPVICGPGQIAKIGHRVAAYGSDLVAEEAVIPRPGDKLAASRTRVHHNAYRVGILVGQHLLQQDRMRELIPA